MEHNVFENACVCVPRCVRVKLTEGPMAVSRSSANFGDRSKTGKLAGFVARTIIAQVNKHI